MNVYVLKRFWFKLFVWLAAIAGFGLGMAASVKQAQAAQVAPTQTVVGVYATVTYSDPINVRGGPSTVYYPIVGRLAPGDIVQALGVSQGREWVQIAYPDAPNGIGWVYAIYVSISGGELQVVEAPATPTPPETATIDPTLAAAFNFQPTATRMPTFTPPPPLTVPQFVDSTPVRSAGVPTGYFVLGLLILGFAGVLVSFVLRK